jgi:hypothetical protein
LADPFPSASAASSTTLTAINRDFRTTMVAEWGWACSGRSLRTWCSRSPTLARKARICRSVTI